MILIPPELVYLHEQISASKDGISSLKKTNIAITIGSISVLVLLMSFMIYSRSKHRKELLKINEQINTTSHDSRIVLEKNLNLSEQVKFLTHEVDTLLSATRSASSIAILNSMCRQIFDIDDSTMRNRMIVDFVKTELDRANHPAFLKNLKRNIPQYKLETLDLIQSEIPSFSSSDYQFLTMILSGLSWASIATILKISKSNYYTRKSRMINKLKTSNNPLILDLADSV